MVSIRFSSFSIYSVQKMNCRNCKRLREFEEIEISRQSFRCDSEKRGGKLLRLLSGFRPRIRPQGMVSICMNRDGGHEQLTSNCWRFPLDFARRDEQHTMIDLRRQTCLKNQLSPFIKLSR